MESTQPHRPLICILMLVFVGKGFGGDGFTMSVTDVTRYGNLCRREVSRYRGRCAKLLEIFVSEDDWSSHKPSQYFCIAPEYLSSLERFDVHGASQAEHGRYDTAQYGCTVLIVTQMNSHRYERIGCVLALCS
ncbi:hypothetical protein HOY82DRAFT_214793 [Tuber indicum]|nr:hypothetical protein HOY82DRAFT_214793 [Tuber indicum]